MVTQGLLQLTTGTPGVIYHGGLLHSAVRHFDPDRKRAGLPESVAALVPEGWMDYAMNGVEPTRCGNRDPLMAPHNCFRCAGEDEWVSIACGTDAEWQALCGAMDQTGLGTDARFRTVQDRKANEDELDRLTSQWTSQYEQRPLMLRLLDGGVPAGMVNDPRDLFEDPQLQHRQHFRWLAHPEIGLYATDRSEFDLSMTPGSLDTPAPLLGQHTEHFLHEIIGLSEEEYRSLEGDGVLE